MRIKEEVHREFLLQSSNKKRVFRVEEPKVLQGPDLQDVPIVISESDYRYFTH